MLRLLVIAICLFLVMSIIYYIKHNKSASAKQKLLLSALLGSLLLLILSGKIHWLIGLVAGTVGFARTLFPFAIRYFPIFAKIFSERKTFSNHQNRDSRTPVSSSDLSREAALEVLGLTQNATEEEIIAAYKRLMQKCHPDRGGSDYLASQLNAAKNILLS